MSDSPNATGGCKCGEMRYALTSQPLTAYICHCHLCQKRTGSAFSMALIAMAGAVEIVSGEPARVERLLETGKRHFTWSCAKCGTQTHTQREDSPTMIVRAGTLDVTERLRPVAQFWTTSAQPWAVVEGAEILSFESQPSDYAPLLEAWKSLGLSL